MTCAQIQYLSPVKPLIGPESPLLRLPLRLRQRDVILLDGIRHAAEMADLAFLALRQELTRFATESYAGHQVVGPFTFAFLNAWSCVDAIDRLRGLCHNLPGRHHVSTAGTLETFHVYTQPLRDLRNIADHLVSRIDYLVKTHGTALGTLTWTTVVSTEPVVLLACAIIPGTVTDRSTLQINPADRNTIIGPTDRITLTAGAISVCLSDVMSRAGQVILDIEADLRVWIDAHPEAGDEAGRDLFTAAAFTLADAPLGHSKTE